MHVAIVGAGALGRIYGVHLADGGAAVTFVVRPSRTQERSAFVIRCRNGKRRRRSIPSPRRSAAVPQGADLVLLAVRADQLDDGIERLLREAPIVPVVALTPLMPAGLAKVEAWVGQRLFVGMPTVAGSLDTDDVVQYWSFRSAPTLIESDQRRAPSVEELCHTLCAGGLAARLSDDVRPRNPATTIAFFPISVGLSLAGGVRGLAQSPELLELSAAASGEGVELARRIGPVELPLLLLARAITPRRLRAALSLAGRAIPRVAAFVDVHFGSKLSGQHLALGQDILAAARTHRVAMPHLEQLLAEAETRDVGAKAQRQLS